jgi:catechol 2,3-dioxygenase-like lactoylglutathione lyase family enzyme
MINRIIHFNVVCTDLDRSIKFYRDLLGGQVLGDTRKALAERGLNTKPTAIAFQYDKIYKVSEPEWRACYIRFGKGSDVTTTIDLLQWIKPAPVGNPLDRANHVGIPRVALEVDDIEKAYKELTAKGVKFLSPPQIVDLKREELAKLKPDLAKPIKFCVCLDPDGTLIELVE